MTLAERYRQLAAEALAALPPADVPSPNPRGIRAHAMAEAYENAAVLAEEYEHAQTVLGRLIVLPHSRVGGPVY